MHVERRERQCIRTRASLHPSRSAGLSDQCQRAYLSDMAYRLLKVAAAGERDPIKLKEVALQADAEGLSMADQR